jgi:predicted transcriptional regulator
VTTYSTEDAKAILERLTTERAVIPLTDPVTIGNLLTAIADAYNNIARSNAELGERLTAIRQTVFPHLREQTQRGELARDVEAEADPQREEVAS